MIISCTQIWIHEDKLPSKNIFEIFHHISIFIVSCQRSSTGPRAKNVNNHLKTRGAGRFNGVLCFLDREQSDILNNEFGKEVLRRYFPREANKMLLTRRLFL